MSWPKRCWCVGPSRSILASLYFPTMLKIKICMILVDVCAWKTDQRVVTKITGLLNSTLTLFHICKQNSFAQLHLYNVKHAWTALALFFLKLKSYDHYT